MTHQSNCSLYWILKTIPGKCGDFDQLNQNCRSSHQRCSLKKDDFKKFPKFIGNHVCQGLLFNKVAGLRLQTLSKKEVVAQVSFCQFLEISKNTLSLTTFEWLLLKLKFQQRKSDILEFHISHLGTHTIGKNERKCPHVTIKALNFAGSVFFLFFFAFTRKLLVMETVASIDSPKLTLPASCISDFFLGTSKKYRNKNWVNFIFPLSLSLVYHVLK